MVTTTEHHVLKSNPVSNFQPQKNPSFSHVPAQKTHTHHPICRRNLFHIVRTTSRHVPLRTWSQSATTYDGAVQPWGRSPQRHTTVPLMTQSAMLHNPASKRHAPYTNSKYHLKVLLCTTKYYSSTTLYYKVLLQYYSVLHSATPVLLCTTKYYSSTTLYYKVLLQYYSVLQSTTPVLLRTTRTTPVLVSESGFDRTRQYYSSTTLYYTVLLRYYSVLQSTTPVLLCTTKYYFKYYTALQSTTPVLVCTTKYYSSTTQYYSVLLQHYSVLQSTTPVLICTTKYYSVLQSTTPVQQSTTLMIDPRHL